MPLKIKTFILATLTFVLAACGGDDDGPHTVYDVINDSEQHTVLATAIDAASLKDALDDQDASLTVFAPTDAAFSVLGDDAAIQALLAETDELTDILTYHVLGEESLAAELIAGAGSTLNMLNGDAVATGIEGSDLYVNFALVVESNMMADNGVVHVIDAVLMPLDLDENPANNIVDTADADGRFTTLLAALGEADLDSVLANDAETFTVFAPTDDAFDMLPTGTITALLGNPDALSAVLLQHVVRGTSVNSVAALTLDGMMVETASGAMVEVSVDFGAEIISIGGANVIIEDIVTSNGIIHVIDSVIVGDVDVPQPSIIDVATEIGGFTTLLGALEATGLDVTLADLDATYTVFAPTDAAFEALDQDLPDNANDLADILTYHVFPNMTVLAEAAIGIAEGSDSKITMVNGDDVALSYNDSTLFANTAQVGPADVMAANGVIHVLDQVLLPPADMGSPTLNIVGTAQSAGNFTTLVSLLGTAGLDTVLANDSETFTVFAPTDAAFALIPDQVLTDLTANVPALTDVLLQHVIVGSAVDSVTAFTLNGTSVPTESGEDVTIEIVDGVLEIQGSAVSTYDIYTTNGVIHVIDAVITETLQ